MVNTQAVPEVTNDVLHAAIAAVHRRNTRPFIENLFWITSKQNVLVPFRYNRLQEFVEKNTTGRDYWIKYRQGGSSVLHLARLLAYACCIPGFNAAVLTLSTDRGRTRERLFRHVTEFINNMPAGMRPALSH